MSDQDKRDAAAPASTAEFVAQLVADHFKDNPGNANITATWDGYAGTLAIVVAPKSPGLDLPITYGTKGAWTSEPPCKPWCWQARSAKDGALVGQAPCSDACRDLGRPANKHPSVPPPEDGKCWSCGQRLPSHSSFCKGTPSVVAATLDGESLPVDPPSDLAEGSLRISVPPLAPGEHVLAFTVDARQPTAPENVFMPTENPNGTMTTKYPASADPWRARMHDRALSPEEVAERQALHVAAADIRKILLSLRPMFREEALKETGICPDCGSDIGDRRCQCTNDE